MIIVRTRSKKSTKGMVEFASRRFACALGRSGCTPRKKEGDGATPMGTWPLVSVYFRPDRVARPETELPVNPIRSNDGWCDAPGDRNYNRPVRLPYPASTETLWREDHLYDLVVVLDYNLFRRTRGAGSAIFMHLARNDYAPTEGCIALREKDLRHLLKFAHPGTIIHVPEI